MKTGEKKIEINNHLRLHYNEEDYHYDYNRTIVFFNKHEFSWLLCRDVKNIIDDIDEFYNNLNEN